MYDLDKLLVVDVETDALFGYTKIHCIVAADLKGNEYVFEEPTKNPYARKRFYALVRDRPVAGNNFLSFDLRALRDLLGADLPIQESDILDTLVLSRLLNYNKAGGHSLENWGNQLGFKKEGADIKDWSTYTPLMLERCKSDVQIGVRMVEKLRKYLEDPSWDAAITTEHAVVYRICNVMSKNGLPFDLEGAHKLTTLLRGSLDPIEAAIQTDFPPRLVVDRVVAPRLTQKGTLNAQDFRWARTNSFLYDPELGRVVLTGPSDDTDPDLSEFSGDPFELCHLEPFNPGSPLQVVERLNEAGWKPTEKTKGHLEAIKDARRNRKSDPETKQRLEKYKRIGWKVSEENLKTLPDDAPESAKKLAQRLVLSSRLSDLEEWIALTSPDGRIHGNYNGIGAWTHRLSHNKPNTANIPVAQRSPKDTQFQTFVNDINDSMRALFIAPLGKCLIGTDADGIQMRIFAHLVGDERLIKALVEGDKANGTDIHSVHKNALGAVCKSRDAAKTFIYAFLLGAGVAKVGEILECSTSAAKAAVDAFLEFYPGLQRLKQKTIPEDAARGYFIGLDGRKVACDSEHLMLAGYLQNGEKVIMARWILKWMDRLESEGILYEILNWVHDEAQTLQDDDPELVRRIQEIQLQAMVDVGIDLNLSLPLLATSAYGHSWKETH